MPLILEVRHLALIDAVADTGSVTRAAERLHLTQSALSHQLRDIESRMGIEFFLRLGRKMVLTPAGERARESARRVLAELTRAEDDLRALADGGRGVLRLCTQCNTGYYWLPPLLKSFNALHPGVEVQIHAEATNRPIEALLGGEIDLGVVTDEIDDERFRVTRLFRDEQVALVSPQHEWANRTFVEPLDFADQHLILYSANRQTSYTFSRILTPAGVEPRRVSQVQLTEAIVEMAAANMGVGILPRWAVKPSIKARNVRALRITRRGFFRTWSAVTLRDRSEPKWMKDFVSLISDRAIPVRAVS